MGKANISNQANRIVYYSLVSYSHKNECAVCYRAYWWGLTFISISLSLSPSRL